MDRTIWTMLGLMLALSFGNCWLQAQNSAQDKVLAMRAAKLDALRQLAESIKGVRISSTTTVKDFVAASDQINASLTTFLKGAQQIGQPRYLPDGTCEVTVGITIEQIIEWLGRSRYLTHEQLAAIRYHNSQRIFTATGTGALQKAPAPDYGNFWEDVPPRGKLMALRAAKVDAYRNMAETIKGVRLSSHTTVKDFVAESDEIRIAFNNFIRGVQFVGPPRYRPDGVVEVTAQFHVDHLIGQLCSISRSHYHGNRWSSRHFYNMKHYYRKRIIKATGSGVPPARYIRRPNPYYPRYPKVTPHPIPTPRPQIPAWAQRTITVTGNGTPPDHIANLAQARLMARRAAQVDAYRNLAEQILGLRISSNITVRDFVTQSDEIQAKVSTLIQGAHITGSYTLADDSVEITMELHLRDMWHVIQPYYNKRKSNY